MIEFIKICDQYPRKFNFSHFFSSLRVISLCLGGDDKNPGGMGEGGGGVDWKAWVKITGFNFLTRKFIFQ